MNQDSIYRQFPLFLVVLAPIVLTVSLPNPINQIGMIDPYVYTGYINDYYQLLARYGTTYYGNRFAYIELGRVASWFGPQSGYLISKLFYLLISVLCAFGIFRRYYPRDVSLFVALWLCFNPWLVRSIFYDYVEAGAVAFAFIGLFCFLRPGRQLPMLLIAGGMASAVAVNIHYLIGVVGVAFVPAWIFLNARYGFWRSLRDVCVIGVGFVAGYLALLAAEDSLFPVLGFFREFRSIEIVRQLLAGGAKNWFIPISAYLNDGQYYVLLPLPVLAASGVWLSRRKGDLGQEFHVAAFIFLLVLVSLYLVSYFVFSSGLITHFWGFFYLLPAVLLCFGCLIGEISKEIDRGARRYILSAGIFLSLFLWFCFPALHVFLEEIPISIYVIVGALFVFSAMLKPTQSWVLAAAMIFAGFANLIFYHPTQSTFSLRVAEGSQPIAAPRSIYGSMHDARWGQIEADTYWGAIDLLRWVGNLIPPAQGRVGFWYSNDDRHRIFNSVQSVFLWGYSRIQSWTDDRGMPVIDEETRKNIESYRYIVLLGFSLKEIDAGVSALRIGGIQFAEIERKTFVGKYLSFEAAIVERLPSEPTFAGRVVDVPTESFKGSGGRITTAGNGIGISTATAQWAYSALADLASMHLPPGPITIRLRLHVKSGSVGFAVSEKGNISKLLTEVDINPTSKPMNVAIPIEDGARAEYLIVRNWSPLGASEVDILNAQ